MKKNNSIKLAEEVYLANRGNITKTERELKKLIKKGQETGDSVLIGAAFFYMGLSYNDIADSEGMLINAKKAVSILKDTAEYELLARVYVLLGVSYEQQGEFKSQIDVYETTYKLIRKHRLGVRAYITVLNNLASCYHHMGENGKAIRMQEECLRLHKEHAAFDLNRTVMYSINLAENYQTDGDPKKAAEIMEAVAEEVKKADFKPYVCDYYVRLALIYFELKETDKAYLCVEIAFNYIEEGSYPLQLYEDMQKVLRQLLKNGEKERARHIFELMKVYAEKRTGITDRIIAYRAMADYYTADGDDKAAIECYVRLDELNEKRRDEINIRQLSLHKKEFSAENEIRKLKKKLLQTEELAFLDPLSKLLNRSALLTVSREFLDAAYKNKEKVGAIFIDIDYFKQCNDTYGHAKGDKIICEVAKACKKEETSKARFARYGGDEFIGITRGISDSDIIGIAKRISEDIRKADIPNELNPNGKRVTLSVGVVNITINHPTDLLEIAGYADMAVYRAKGAGKNRVCYYDAEKGNDTYEIYEIGNETR